MLRDPVFNGFAIRELRMKANKTQHDIAGNTGILVSTLCQIESGKQPNPSFLSVVKIAKYFGRNVNDFIKTKDRFSPHFQISPIPENLDLVVNPDAFIKYRNKLNYHEASHNSNVEVGSIWRLEKKLYRNPEFLTVARFAQFFNASLDEFYKEIRIIKVHEDNTKEDILCAFQSLWQDKFGEPLNCKIQVKP